MDQAFPCRVTVPTGRIPRGHLMEFVTLGPGPNMPSAVDVDEQGNEDETGDVQVVIWRDMLTRRGRESGSQVVEVHMGCKSQALG